jgi:UTP--glucose-1-phosphate uridylyltransferase
MQYDERFLPFQRRMREAGIPELFIGSFAHYYHQLLEGDTGLIPEEAIEPAGDLAQLTHLSPHLHEVGRSVLPRTALIKLNGGLGTSMGLAQPKSLLEVKNGLTFLDIIAGQSVRTDVPLILMNSFATEEETCMALRQHQELDSELSQTFVQHMEPKVRQEDFAPAEWPPDPALAWCPPGHGDIYIAMVTQGILGELLAAGYRYAFVSNADNLGAIIDTSILGYFAENQVPFMMEVAQRTESDRKGGHLARRRDSGHLLLRESAQCPPEASEAFQDIERYSYFNTNNLWLDLRALDRKLRERAYNLGLPMIRNSKTLDPRDETSIPVYQLETAMGAAIEVFENSEAIVVPRSRFAPVKKTDDLLVVRSDVYELTDEYVVRLRDERSGEPPDVQLDPTHYQYVQDFDRRFTRGVPSLLACEKLRIQGDYSFGAGVVISGTVELVNNTRGQQHVPDGALLEDVSAETE